MGIHICKFIVQSFHAVKQQLHQMLLKFETFKLLLILFMYLINIMKDFGVNCYNLLLNITACNLMDFIS